jgi:hypothetical protein
LRRTSYGSAVPHLGRSGGSKAQGIGLFSLVCKGGTFMTLYQLAGYLHLIGGVGLFVALGLEWAMIVRIRSAHSVEQARAWLSLVAFQRPVGLASLITVLIAGLYMAVTAWGAVAWISATEASLLLMMAFGAYNGLNLAPLDTTLKAERGTLTLIVWSGFAIRCCSRRSMVALACCSAFWR